MTKCYYGDAFVINGKGLVVFGKGKTKVISNRIILKEDENNYRICNDSICFEEKDGELYVIPDPLQGHSFDLNIPKPKIEDGHVVNFMFYHNSPDESKVLKSLTVDDFVHVSEFNINFPIDGNGSIDRVEEMLNLLKGKKIKLFSIPWCDTEDERAKIIKKILYN